MNAKKTIKIVAQSTFHGNISQAFRVPAEFGQYERYCPNACDDAHDKNGIQIHCGCGWPCGRTEWSAPKGFLVRAEWAEPEPGKKNNITIFVEPDWEVWGAKEAER